MVSDTQEARDFLGVTGDLSLKIKTGKIQIEGLGQYMKESYSRSKVVEILVKVHYETVIKRVFLDWDDSGLFILP